MEAYLTDDLWLRLARHANAMADRLADGLKAAGFAPVWPVEANEVFVVLPRSVCGRLKAEGASFYPWTTASLPAGSVRQDDDELVRLVTSFATQPEEVGRFLAIVAKA
jgi:threonine aldolase